MPHPHEADDHRLARTGCGVTKPRDGELAEDEAEVATALAAAFAQPLPSGARLGSATWAELAAALVAAEAPVADDVAAESGSSA